MELLRIGFITSLVLTLGSCQKNPTACVNIDDAVEAGTTLTLTSCSEDYEFLSWRFDDGLGTTVDDQVQRAFVDETDHRLTLTAYAKNGYRSDEIIVDFKSSYRYVDYVEVIGDSPYSKFIVDCFSTFKTTDAKGTFTNQSPYTFQVYPDKETRIRPEIYRVQFTGERSNGSKSLLGSQSFNFETFKNNPITIVADGYEMNLYWTFKD